MNKMNDNNKEKKIDPLPLHAKHESSAPYPIKALGEVLGPLAEKMLKVIQAPDSVIGQSLLGATALSVQGFADIINDGRIIPLNLYFVSVACTGERKTTCDKLVTLPHKDFEKEAYKKYTIELQEYRSSLKFYQLKKREVFRENKKETEIKQALEELKKNLEPEPYNPLIFATDFTIEGLFKMLEQGSPSIGVFIDEGGQVTGGRGFSGNQSLKIAGWLSKFWDGGRIDRVRSADGVFILYNRRLSMHLMIYPEAAINFLNNDSLNEQGLISRILMAYPDSMAGTRFYNDENIKASSEFFTYYNKVQTLLKSGPPLLKDQQGFRINELDPRLITICPKAKDMWLDFYNWAEQESGASGKFATIRGFANKIGEHSLRIAGILSLFRDINTTIIDKQALTDAIELCHFYLKETLRIAKISKPNKEMLIAGQVLNWLIKWSKKHKSKYIALPEIYENAHPKVRNAAKARLIMEILTVHGYTKKHNKTFKTFKGKNFKENWEILI